MEDHSERGAGSEQQRWEQAHLNAALLKFGARDAKERKKSKKYEVIMDEEIEFVQALKMPGTVKDKVGVRISERQGRCQDQ